MDEYKMNKMDGKSVVNQNIIIENREKISVTGVIDIHSFDDELVIAQTDLGILTVKGDDLKMNKLKAENIGQMNMYLNYYENVVNNKEDGKPIGIILCAEKDKVALEYALGGLSNNIFASTYTYYIPNKELLINEVEKVLESSE